jgi:signal transduction histidine kinase
MGQLISNLVGNAIEHGLDPIVIDVNGADEEVRLRVSNHGKPIPKEVVPGLFNPFRRYGWGNEQSNLGLGLFIVGEIVHRHSGKVDVASNEEETAFTVRLPRFPALAS